MKFFCAARTCGTDFYKAMQRDPNGNCRYSTNVLSEKMSEVSFFGVSYSDFRRFPMLNTLYPGSSVFNP